MEYAIKLVAVFGSSILELWAAIPLGFVFQINPIVNGLVSSAGSIVSVFIITFFGTKLRDKIYKGRQKNYENSKIYKIWIKYGIAGLGLLSPILTGAPFGTALGLSLGAPPKKILFWMSLGVVIWTVALVTLGILGITTFKSI